MKKLLVSIFILTLTCSLLVGDELDKQYETALNEYKSGDFKASYEILSKLYMDNLSDADLNFHLGRSAYETGHYEMALAAFERVEMLDEGNLGVTQFINVSRTG